MAVFTELTCPECGERHTFCLPGADVFQGKTEYEYICPQTKRTVRRTFYSVAKIVPGCIESAVIVREVKPR